MLKKWKPNFPLWPYGDGGAQIDSTANANDIGFWPFSVILKNYICPFHYTIDLRRIDKTIPLQLVVKLYLHKT
jgi:hypothetical protein